MWLETAQRPRGDVANTETYGTLVQGWGVRPRSFLQATLGAASEL